jgi:hypothetical protein
MASGKSSVAMSYWFLKFMSKYSQRQIHFFNKKYFEMLKERRLNNEVVPYENFADYFEKSERFLIGLYWDEFFNFQRRVNRH